jgi:geranylgeranyl reductase family protein
VWDLVVVGAGPAGATAALAAMRTDPAARVLLLDRADFPRDKACGDGIAVHVADQLRQLGAAQVLAGAPPITGLRLTTPGGVVAAGRPRRANYVVPRTDFDARLVAAAVDAGAQLHKTKVRTVTSDGPSVVLDEGHTARVVVAADGANSTVRRLLGLPANQGRHLGIAVRGYAPGDPAAVEQRIDMVADGWPAYAWDFPTGIGLRNVGIGVVRDQLRGGKTALHERLMQRYPETDAATLRAHHLPFSSSRPQPAHGRVLLAGDAASLINPLSGEGIYYAVVSGRLAGEAAIRRPDAAGAVYRRGLHATLGRHFFHTATLARVIRHRPLVEAAVRLAARRRPAYDELVEIALGQGLMRAGTLARVVASYRPASREEPACAR